MAINFRGRTLCCPSRLPRGLSSVFFKWRSSLYKLCHKELIFFLIFYFTLTIVYRHALNKNQQRFFEHVVNYFAQYLKMISLPFLLGFFVTTVAARWWQQYMALPWPDRLALAIATYMPGTDDESKLVRKTLVRQCNLMAVLLLRGLSNPVFNREKVLEDAVRAGCMTETEKISFESIKSDVNLYWLPGLWFAQNLQSAFKQGRVKDTYGAKLIMEEFLEFRDKCGVLWTYAWINIPLIYTQVVTLAAYSFFIACIIGRQRIVNPQSNEGILSDIFFGVYSLLQFFFYIGLLKVAEQMINPYGTDDEHFDLDFLLDRHSKVIDLCTDSLSDQYPSEFHELLSQVVREEILGKELKDQEPKKTKISVDRIFNLAVMESVF